MPRTVLLPTPELKLYAPAGGVGMWAWYLAKALAEAGVTVIIVLPLHGGTLPSGVPAEPLATFEVRFNGRAEPVKVYRGTLPGTEVEVLFVENRTYFGGSAVYSYDEIPFMSDTQKYAFFAKVLLRVISDLAPDIVHGSDWTAGYLFGWMLLANLAADTEGRQRPYPQRRVLTVHNISYQGQTWKGRLTDVDFRDLAEHEVIGSLFDDPRPEYECVNPLRLAMELADGGVNCVSSTNAVEITRPPNPSAYFAGGQGLEGVASRLESEGRLHGILNGQEYETVTNGGAA